MSIEVQDVEKQQAAPKPTGADRLLKWLRDQGYAYLRHQNWYSVAKATAAGDDTIRTDLFIFTETDLVRWWRAACDRFRDHAETMDSALLLTWPSGRGEA